MSRERMLPALTGLLSAATEAQGDQPPEHKEMKAKDREWLENALQQLTSDSDPVKAMKQLMGQLAAMLLNNIDVEPSHLTDADAEQVDVLVEELNDLVCDMDLALDFCTMGGLQLVWRFLNTNVDQIGRPFVGLVAVIAQHNPRVQEQVRRAKLLEHCMAAVVDAQRSQDYKHTCVYAISSIVKAYLPAFSQFTRQHGPDALFRCFEWAISKGEPAVRKRLAHRCVVAAVSIRDSFPTEILERCPSAHRVLDVPAEMRTRLEEQQQQRANAPGNKEGGGEDDNDGDRDWIREAVELLGQ